MQHPLDNLYTILHGRFYGKIVYKFYFYFLCIDNKLMYKHDCADKIF